MTADELPAVQQTNYFETRERQWRGQINSEDLTLADLMDVLRDADAAGMPPTSLVSFPPGGDMVTKVHVTDRHVVALPRRDEVTP